MPNTNLLLSIAAFILVAVILVLNRKTPPPPKVYPYVPKSEDSSTSTGTTENGTVSERIEFEKIVTTRYPTIFLSGKGKRIKMLNVEYQCGSGMASALNVDSTQFYTAPYDAMNEFKVLNGKLDGTIEVPVGVVVKEMMCKNGSQCRTPCVKVKGVYDIY